MISGGSGNIWTWIYKERLYCLLGGRRDIGQRPRVAERDTDNTRDMSEFLIRQVDEAKRITREDRDIDINPREKAIGGLNDEMKNMEKYLEKSQDKMSTSGTSLASTEIEAHMLSSEINRVRYGPRGPRTIEGTLSIVTRYLEVWIWMIPR